MDERSLERILEARRRDLARELAQLTERPKDAGPNLSFGKRIGDGTNEAVERINSTAAARSVAASLAEVERAMVKLAEDTYGRCDACGRTIPEDRLGALPWAAHCVDCRARLHST
jgi:DnaK suppressor protein